MIESILVPTDGSDGSLAGARRGIDLARRTEAELHVLSVVDTREVEAVRSELDEEVEREAFESGAEEAIDAVVEAARSVDPDARVTTAIEWGVPFEAIGEYADDHGIDVIAMGTRGRTGFDRLLLGSVTENVLRTADVPVFAIPPGAGRTELDTDTYGNVLVPTDGSDGATAAVGLAVELASTLDARLHTVYSVDTRWLAPSRDAGAILDALERRGERALSEVRELSAEHDLGVTGSVASGPAHRLILRYVEENDVDLVVMGTHGRSGVRQRLLGSVTETVVRHADVPVLCVPIGRKP